jgi:hypothetical protein
MVSSCGGETGVYPSCLRLGDSVLTLNEMLVFAPVNETSVVVGWNID